MRDVSGSKNYEEPKNLIGFDR
ncbi:hypothetical protein MNV_560085 [Candidatus Methanoperedens nitroreducens]|uniref:Uncharacterized protein n=1 Tax=Candidatus Methanoperedens nitratireducens TaxID=1392998 RepID=A0A284VS50_9EURY|nr:hypothetical protein MNV_560085 [Candidatus Methanoperedens nitroreducens]